MSKFKSVKSVVCVLMVVCLLLPASVANAEDNYVLRVEQSEQTNWFTLVISRLETSRDETVIITWPMGIDSLSIEGGFCDEPSGCEQEDRFAIGTMGVGLVFKVESPGSYRILVQPPQGDQLELVFEAVFFEMDLAPHSSVIDFRVEEGSFAIMSSVLTNLGSPLRFSTLLTSADGSSIPDCISGFESEGYLDFGESSEFLLEVSSSCFNVGTMARFVWVINLFSEQHDCTTWSIRRGVQVLVIPQIYPPPPIGDERLYLPLVIK